MLEYQDVVFPPQADDEDNEILAVVDGAHHDMGASCHHNDGNIINVCD